MTVAETRGSVQAALAPLNERWSALTPRDRRMAVLAGAVVVLFITWKLAVQPALQTLAAAPIELDALDAQLQVMQRLATESNELRAAPPVTLEQASAVLQAATQRLGEQGKLTLQGDRAVLELNDIGTTALSDWLTEARAGARIRPLEAKLSRAAHGYSGKLIVGFGGGS